jgi:hypothetical protein
MNEYPIPEGRRLDQTRATFGEIEEANVLLRAASGNAPAMISPSRLYACATGAVADDPEVEAALGRNPAMRAAYRRMIESAARYAMPEAMAASSGGPAPRQGEGCRIRFERSRAEPNLFFVIVELTDEAAEPPQALIVCDAEDRCRQFPLPGMRNGTAQMIADENSDLMCLLGDPKSRAYLR